jgi:hypothetical protein
MEGCPRDLFTNHITAAITQWTQEGDQIILMIDSNEDIRLFSHALQHTGLREVLLTRHGQNSPTTFNRGSIPIDGIFASPTLDIIAGGYLEFGFCPLTDHRGLWIDIHYQAAFGHIMPAIVTANARRLKTTDPRIVTRYTDTWSKFILEHNMLERAYRYKDTAHTLCYPI